MQWIEVFLKNPPEADDAFPKPLNVYAPRLATPNQPNVSWAEWRAHSLHLGSVRIPGPLQSRSRMRAAPPRPLRFRLSHFRTRAGRRAADTFRLLNAPPSPGVCRLPASSVLYR